jgi:hypothetical protein
MISIFLVIFIILAIVIRVAEIRNWNYRTKKYPEHAITREWDDEDAEYIYFYEYYGRVAAQGDKVWAQKQAKHYGIEVQK